MGTGTSKGKGGRGSGHSGEGAGSERGGRTGNGGVRGETGRAGTRCGSERPRRDLYAEWLISWMNQLGPEENFEEENDEDDDPAHDGEEARGAGEPAEASGGTSEAARAASGAAGAAGGAGGARETPTEGGNASNGQPAAPRVSSLKVTGVDLKPGDNRKSHNTDEYEFDKSTGKDFIVRRGQEFKIDILLSRPFKQKKERILLQFSVSKADLPRPIDGTQITLDINGPHKDGEWSAKMESTKDKIIEVTVNASPNAIVGSYKLTVKVENRASELESVFPQDKQITLLFNPWCEKDAVFMGNKAEREEYVLNDNGTIWRGCSESNRGKPWIFGQFDLEVYRVVFELLEKDIEIKDRRSAIRVSRYFTHIINEEVLIGNWSGDYEGHTHPCSWKGSVRILKEYGETNKPVKYGQCWVFSGLLTTFLRCVGIPARSITNFGSAHDTENNMTIDRYHDSDGKELAEYYFRLMGGEKDKTRTIHDSIWNFHVWNEAWMTRKDLHSDNEFDGWQAVDSTPQEESEGKMQCGPAPVEAVKRGIVNLGYDTGFVFAEVNADDVSWLVEPYPNHRKGLKFTVLSLEKDTVGQLISTKQVGCEERNDITLDYKYKEGSDEERAAIEEALSKGINRGMYDIYAESGDAKVEIERKRDLWIGNDFSIKIETKNESDFKKDIHLETTIQSIVYTGEVIGTIKTEGMDFVLQGKESVANEIHVKYEDYGEMLDNEGLFRVAVAGRSKGSTKPIRGHRVMRLKQPDLKVEADVNGSEVKLMVEFTNPINKALTNCTFFVEAPKLVKPFQVKREDIKPKENIKFPIQFTSISSGRKTVVVELDTDTLKDIDGSVKVEVKEGVQ